MSDTEHFITQSLMRKMWYAYREVHLLEYHTSRKTLADLTRNVAKRLGVSEEEATEQMLAKFKGDSK